MLIWNTTASIISTNYAGAPNPSRRSRRFACVIFHSSTRPVEDDIIPWAIYATVMEIRTMPATDGEHNFVELAAQMYDLSVQLWKSLEREYDPALPPYVWMMCDLREEVESMQDLLKVLQSRRWQAGRPSEFSA